MVTAVARTSGRLTLVESSRFDDDVLTILLIEPHEICCLAIARLISESRLRSARLRQTHDQEEGISLAALIAPGLIIHGPGAQEGRDSISRLREAAPGAKVLFLSWDEEPSVIVEALLAGADGIVPKSAPAEQLKDAIERVASGETVIDPTLAVAAALWTGRRTEELERREEALGGLSNREREILDLVDSGLSSKEIADETYISRRTVESHLANAYRKLGVHERIGAIFAYRKLRGLSDDVGPETAWSDARERSG